MPRVHRVPAQREHGAQPRRIRVEQDLGEAGAQWKPGGLQRLGGRADRRDGIRGPQIEAERVDARGGERLLAGAEHEHEAG